MHQQIIQGPGGRKEREVVRGRGTEKERERLKFNPKIP